MPKINFLVPKPSQFVKNQGKRGLEAWNTNNPDFAKQRVRVSQPQKREKKKEGYNHTFSPTTFWWRGGSLETKGSLEAKRGARLMEIQSWDGEAEVTGEREGEYGNEEYGLK